MLSPEAFDTEKVKHMDDTECRHLCDALRSQLIQDVSKTGGHLASNLGAVELTVAVHRVFDTSRDRLVFDVGHQCYCHKILTGRGGMMDTLRTFGGLSGFPKPTESVHDAFIAGHASNSVSVALGMARARTQLGEDYNVLALIGDGALTGGLSYEGMSDAGQSRERLIILLNDNGMSIRKNVGGISEHLARQRLKPQYIRFKKFYRRITSHGMVGRAIYRVTHNIKRAIKNFILPSSYFEDMGFAYLGPVNGHDVDQLTQVLEYAKEMEMPVVVHIRTVKGKGYAPAEETPANFHGVSKFDPATGKPLKPSSTDFSAVFGKTLCELAERDSRICAVSAAMLSGTGLVEFSERFPDRCYDVGIAEGHAVAMCGGMAKQGVVPVFAVYSTFLQRGYDMLMHDIALLHLHAVFGVDRAGLVGADGETHQGVFDVAYLSTVPGMTVLAPASFAELRTMLTWAVEEADGPVAVRYPRGGENGYSEDAGLLADSVLCKGNDITLVSYGTMTGEVLKAAEKLRQDGISPEIIKINRLCPLDAEPVLRSLEKTGRLLVAEEVSGQGCIGEALAAAAAVKGCCTKSIRLLNLGDTFVHQGEVGQLRKARGIDSESIYRQAGEACKVE